MSLAPENNRLVAEIGRTLLTGKITNFSMGTPIKFSSRATVVRLNLNLNIESFRIAIGQAQLREHERKADYCQLFAGNIFSRARVVLKIE